MSLSSTHQSHSSTSITDPNVFRQMNDKMPSHPDDVDRIDAGEHEFTGEPGDFASHGQSLEPHASTPYATPYHRPGYQKSVGRYVAARPYQSAMVAAAAGALATILLRLKVRKQLGLRRFMRVR